MNQLQLFTAFLFAASLACVSPAFSEDKERPSNGGIDSATKKKPFMNSLGMKFVPVISNTNGKKVYFSIWETRVKDYRVFVEATGRDMSGETYSMDSNERGLRGASWKDPKFPIDEDHCVIFVNWNDAKAFAKWLTQKERKAGLIGPNQEYRLPKDVEWSYAVGLGKEQGNTPEERDEKNKGGYPWGDYWPPKDGNEGNYAGEESYWGGAKKVQKWHMVEGGYRDQHPRTAPVGSYRANKYGLYDMGGNALEWCEDLYYAISEDYYTVRGACWHYTLESALRSSNRTPSLRSSRGAGLIGFRVVLELNSDLGNATKKQAVD